MTDQRPPGRTRVKAVVPHLTKPDPREVADRERLLGEVKDALARVRRTAENWRTGMAGLTALVTGTLLFKGRQDIADYPSWARYVLGGLVIASLVLTVVSLLLFLAAAYGRTAPTSAQSIIDGGGVDVFNVGLATAALRDLRLARRLALVGATLLAAALLLSWYAPAPSGKPDAYVTIVVDGGPQAPAMPLCGVLRGLDGKTAVLQMAGEPTARTIATDRIVSLRLVSSC